MITCYFGKKVKDTYEIFYTTCSIFQDELFECLKNYHHKWTSNVAVCDIEKYVKATS